MKSVSLKTLSALLVFVLLLSLRLKLYRDRQISSQIVKQDKKLPEHSSETKKVVVEEKSEPTKSEAIELTNLTDIYEQRRQHVGKVCKDYRVELEERYSKRWPDRSWETFLGMSDILEKTDQGFLWCKVPKAASESWTSLFIKRWFRGKSNLLMWKQQVYLHSRWQPKYKTAKYLTKIAKTHFTFMTIRHPFERLLSAYRDKFFLKGEHWWRIIFTDMLGNR